MYSYITVDLEIHCAIANKEKIYLDNVKIYKPLKNHLAVLHTTQ